MRRAYAGLLLALSGCDPTSGLADTADAALPNEKRYFDGAGSLLAEGPWNRVVIDLDADTLYHVGARRLDDDEPTFHLFGADAQKGCQITPNAGTWLMGKPEAAPFRVLPFLEDMDSRGRGRLRFSTLDCEVQDLVVEDAGRPYPRLYDHGYLVPTKQGYTFADPWTGESHEIAANLQSVVVWKDTILLWADDQLKSFSEQFEPGDAWGNGLEALVPFEPDFIVEDADGVHHVTFDQDSLAISAEDVLPDACALQHTQLANVDPIITGTHGLWVMLQQPCGNPKPTIAHLDATTGEALDTFELPIEADSRYARALLSYPDASAPGTPLGAAYLTDVDDQGLGTLWVWRVDGDAPLRIGEHGSLNSLSLGLADAGWVGNAEVNYRTLGSYLAHDLVHFRWDGTTEVVSEGIIRNSTTGEYLVNFDGVAADWTSFDSEGNRSVLEGVPPDGDLITSYIGERQYARVDHFDGAAGRLLLGAGAKGPGNWRDIASAVQPASPRFCWFMPALLFMEDWDPQSKTGSLVAYNYELDARDTIAKGVSSFDLTSYPWDGVVYAVPEGKQRGIWFSKAK